MVVDIFNGWMSCRQNRALQCAHQRLVLGSLSIFLATPTVASLAVHLPALPNQMQADLEGPALSLAVHLPALPSQLQADLAGPALSAMGSRMEFLEPHWTVRARSVHVVLVHALSLYQSPPTTLGDSLPSAPTRSGRQAAAQGVDISSGWMNCREHQVLPRV